jgi:hypothetical protein
MGATHISKEYGGRHRSSMLSIEDWWPPYFIKKCGIKWGWPLAAKLGL